MSKDKWDLPYPDEQEIDRQAAMIVKQAFPDKRYFLKEMQDFKGQMGWMYVLPNRSEIAFSSLVLIVSIFCIWLITTTDKTISPFLYGYVFLIAPISLILQTAYAFYEKWEKQTFELEMTMKVTIFQLIAVRVLAFSGISLFTNMTATFILVMNFEVEFLRIWLISLTGLFAFASGLLWFIAKGNVWKRSLTYMAGWVAINSAWLFMMKDSYLRIVFHLPLIVYTGILLVIIGIFIMAFKKAFTRKQEGLWTC